MLPDALHSPNDIAIVGMACRFPGISSLAQMWDVVRGGRHTIQRGTREALRQRGVAERLLADPNYVPAWGVPNDLDCFDAAFFDIGPRDAAVMDPQTRHFLELAWEVLENAGHVPATFPGSIGVYAGSGQNTYLLHNLLSNPQLLESLGMFALRHTANDKDFLSTTTSYRLDLHGPSVNVQTACSTSLVAIHVACQALLAGECDMALAGGVTIDVNHEKGYLYRPSEILSPDGFCRPFERRSAGTVLTSGAGIIALRRLEDALRDRDHIWAVIKATAINNDGASKVGYLAPSVDGHAAVASEALDLAGFTGADVQYVEAHGTGTAIGDPIELAALSQAYAGALRSGVRLGSVKANIGHTDTAAGVASVMKTALALHHAEFPPLAGFSAPNPLLGLQESPFAIDTEAQPWPGDVPRRAGVSSLGVGGTNAHAVLQEAPQVAPTPRCASPLLMPVSARTPEAADRSLAALESHLAANGPHQVEDACFTLQHGRAAFRHRRAFLWSGPDDAAGAPISIPRTLVAGDAAAPAALAFLFPGGGAFYPGMGADLYRRFPVYREALDRCLEALSPSSRECLCSLLLEVADPRDAARQLERPSLQLPAVFATEYALAQLLISWGVVPTAMLGHSLGEYTAATIAGVFTPEDAARTVTLRGELMERVSGAAMTSVLLSADELERRLPPGLSLAVVNGPQLCVVSGSGSAIAAFEQRLAREGVECRRVRIGAAAHSSLLDPGLAEFEAHMGTVSLSPPSIPFASNVTGTWITPAEATDPLYWVRHLRQPVRFDEGLATLVGDGRVVLLEVGAGSALSSLARQQPVRSVRAIPCLLPGSDGTSETEAVFTAIATAWVNGAPVDWSLLHPHDCRRVPLPTYPFEKTRHWIEPGQPAHRELERAPDIADWFWCPVWKRTPFVTTEDAGGRLLLLGADGEHLSRLRSAAEVAGFETVSGVFGSRLKRLSLAEYELRAAARTDYDALLDDLRREDRLPAQVLLLAERSRSVEDLVACLLALGQALASLPPASVQELVVVTESALRTGRERVARPAPAALTGALRVVANELGIHWRLVDLESLRARDWEPRCLQVLRSPATDRIVACRADELREQELHRVQLHGGPSALKQGGVYVITGGFGGLGLALAQYLAEKVSARVVLLARSPLPPRTAWDARLAEHTPHDRTNRVLKALLDIEATGGEVLPLQADITRPEDVRGAFEAARRQFGRIDGVFHTAGTVDDGLLTEKTPASVAAVLAPKVDGAFHVVRAARAAGVGFVALFSSTSASLGLPGQFDYAAANAFQDHLAANTRDSRTRVLSVAWAPWRELGMAAARFEPHLPAPPPGEVLRLDPSTDWRFLEHEIEGLGAVLPGSAMLELLATGHPYPAVELREVAFTAPLLAVDAPSATIATGPGGASRIATTAGEHVRATIGPAATAPRFVDLAALRAHCSRAMAVEAVLAAQSNRVRFGPRWDCLRSVHTGEQEALATLSLPDAHAPDLDRHPLHPALLDLATGFAFYLGEPAEAAVYVPLGFDRLTVYSALPSEIVSHVRIVRRAEGLLVFDGTVTATDGSVLVEFEGYQVRRLSGVEELAEAATRVLAPVAPTTPVGELARDIYFSGLRQDEAFEALERVLRTPALDHVVVTPVPLPALVDAVRAASSAHADASIKMERPSLESTYVAPADDVELTLLRIWEDLLGVAGIGVDDDFFDLGGHSLVAVRMFNRVRDTFGPLLPLSTLFEAGTVRKLAGRVRGSEVTTRTTPAATEGDAAAAWRSLVPIHPEGTGPPLFCIHGMTGNVLFLRDLATRMPADVPFYALQARGLDGDELPDQTIEEMATHYIEEIRTVQARGPYLLAGYSGGGVIAYEMARQLREQGEDTVLLAFLDCFSPRYLDKTRFERVQWFLRGVRDGKVRFVARWAKVKAAKRLRRRSSAPVELQEPAEAVDISGTFVRAHDAYVLTPLDVPITLFRARERAEDGYVPLDLGWTPYVRSVDVHLVPGGHESMCLEPHVTVLASELARARKEALSANGDHHPAREHETTAVLA